MILFVNSGGVGTGGRAGGGVGTPHCTGAPAPNGPLVHTPNASPPGGANPPAGVEAPAVNIPASQWPRCASRKATARICSRGDKEPLRPLFHNPSREPGSVIAPHNSAPARTTVTHFVHLPRECAALPSPPRRGGRCPSAEPRFHRAHTTRESSGTREASAGGRGDLGEPHASPPGHARPAAAVAAPFSKKPLISPLERFRISGGRLSGRRAEVSTSKKMAAYSRGRSRGSPSLKRGEVLGTFAVSDARPPSQSTSTTLDSL